MLTLTSSLTPLARKSWLTYGRRMALHDRIKQARKHAKLTQQQLGERLGVSKQAVTMWEGNKNPPNRDNLIAIAAATQVSVSWLITGQPLPEQTLNGTLVFRDNGGRTVPLVTALKAAAGIFDEAGAPRISTVFPCSDRAFAIVVDTRSNSDVLPVGARAVFDPKLQAEPGELVFAVYGLNSVPIIGRLRYETTAAGQVTIVEPTNRDFAAARSDLGPVQIVAPLHEHTQPGRLQS